MAPPTSQLDSFTPLHCHVVMDYIVKVTGVPVLFCCAVGAIKPPTVLTVSMAELFYLDAYGYFEY